MVHVVFRKGDESAVGPAEGFLVVEGFDVGDARELFFEGVAFVFGDAGGADGDEGDFH